jgi:bifunctional UDP-N-acetylglucosamine pyrophosphorylase/glucosamine-1-phosphate N-acetyltransferase
MTTNEPRQAVLMAAGLGMRLLPLTLTTPKPLLPVAGRPILEYGFDALPASVEEVIIVVGYLKEKIIAHFGNEWRGRRVTYAEAELKGTGHAVACCRHLLKGRFFVLNGDDLYSADDLAAMSQYDQAILTMEATAPCVIGAMKTDEHGNLEGIIEGSEIQPGDLINTGACLLDTGFFDYPLVPIRDGKEFGLPQTVVTMSKERPVHVVRASFWMPVGKPEELTAAEAVMLGRRQP